MITKTTPRGFTLIVSKEYTTKVYSRLIQESSAVGDYPDSFNKPGSSFLWVGEKHHLNREEVQELINKMQHWLNTGTLHDSN